MKNTNGPIILELPISYEELINSSFSIEKRLEEILHENPTNINAANNKWSNEQYCELNFIEPEIKDHTTLTIENYHNIDSSGVEYSTTVQDIKIMPTVLDTSNIEKIKCMKTNIACWWCTYTFDTYPVCAPLKYDECKDIFKVKGCFCSFNCAKSYLFFSERKTDLSIVSYLHKRITNKFSDIKKAPPKEILQKYGGPVSIDEYRQSFSKVLSYNLIEYPMIYIPSQLEKRKYILDDKKLSKETFSIYNKNKEKAIAISSVKIKKSIGRDALVKNSKKTKNTNSLNKMFSMK